MSRYGEVPECIASLPGVDLVEFMHYQYLPVKMAGNPSLRLPDNLAQAKGFTDLLHEAISCESLDDKFVYVTTRNGYATPDNPLNRPGWHCDGFGTEDINYVWWSRWATRFAIQPFVGISPDHLESMRQFDEQVNPDHVLTRAPDRCLYRLTPYVVHATPEVPAPGGMRQFIKVSVSTERYNLLGNSHNYLFDYDWKMYSREEVRNDPAYGEADSIPEDLTA